MRFSGAGGRKVGGGEKESGGEEGGKVGGGGKKSGRESREGVGSVRKVGVERGDGNILSR